MKKYIFAATLSLLAIATTAQTNVQHTDSVTTISNPGNVIINETANGVTVKVLGQNDSTVVYSYKNQYSENATIITEQKEDFGFDIPFLKSKRREKQKTINYPDTIVNHVCHWDAICNGVGAGLTMMMSTPSDMVGHRKVGGEFMIANLIGVRYTPTYNGPMISLGFGIHWGFYQLRNGLRFNKEANMNNVITEPFANGSEKTSSNLHTFSLLVPLDVKYKFNETWGIGVGAWANFTTHACESATYYLDDVKISESWNGIEKRKFRLSYVAQVKFKEMNLYVKYTPKNAIKDGYGPQFKDLSVGVTFGF